MLLCMSFSDISGVEQKDDNTFQLTEDLNKFTIDRSKVPTNFTGSLDGNGHKIKGLSNPFIEQLSGEIYHIVFENMKSPVVADNKGTVTNITVKNANITGSRSGSICEENHSSGVIKECEVIETTITGGHIGLISGINAGEIYECDTDGSIKGKITGGICGLLIQSGSVYDCSSTAELVCDWKGGGIIGSDEGFQQEQVLIQNCLFTGTIDVQRSGGGVLIGGQHSKNTERVYKSCTVNTKIASEEDGLRADKIEDCDFEIYLESNVTLFKNKKTILNNSTVHVTVEDMLGFSFTKNSSNHELHDSKFDVTVRVNGEMTNEPTDIFEETTNSNFTTSTI